MIQHLRTGAFLLAILAGLLALAVVRWPGWEPRLTLDGPLLPWQAASLSHALVDARGQMLPDRTHGLLLAAIAVLLAAVSVTACFDLLVPRAIRHDTSAALAVSLGSIAAEPPIAEEINAEIAKMLALLRSLLEANGLHGAALTRINAQLPALVAPDQIRMVVSYLIMENANMRNRTRDLTAALETSKQQIERLKGNLAEARAEGLSDPLTTLKNRRAFDLILASEAATARKGGAPLCLVLADIDHFKTINDRFGHPGGDAALRWAAHLIRNNVKGRDTVARYGGEEFALILPQTELSAARGLADRIRQQIETTPWMAPDAGRTPVRVTVSFGIGQLRDGESTEGLLRRVDTKLYDAKQAGRNRVMA